MKSLLSLSILAALMTGCCCPEYYHGRKHGRRSTPLPHRQPEPVIAQQVAPTHQVVVPQVPPASTPSQVVSPGDAFDLKTEDISVDKRTVSNGAVRIRRYVTSQEVSVPTKVCREEYVVERVPASGSTSAPFGDAESHIDILLTKEVVTPVITPRIYETLRVKKTVVCETNEVRGTLRTEKADVGRSN